MSEDVIYMRVIQSLVGLIGILGNSLVCVVIWRVRAMHTLTNAFIFNQAVVDLVASLLLLLVSNIDLSERVPPGVAGLLLCYLWITRFFLWSSFATSTTNLVALTVERYVAIVFPFKHQAYFGPRLAAVLITACWSYGFASSGFNLVWVTYSEPNGTCKPYALPEPPVISAFMLLQMNFLLPVTVMCVAYCHIAVTLKRSARRIAPGAHTSSASTQGSTTDVNTLDGSLARARRNTFKTLLMVFVVYVICWAPNTAIFSLFLLGVNVDLGGVPYIVSLALVVCNSCANPIVYSVKYRQFRKGVRKLFRGTDGRPDNDADISTVSARVSQRYTSSNLRK
ncbi:somatostatin receptor type 5-like [Patiria miniata]|uniref:G-protein coupled receptors family 1 profile domain-containing protein n=1 Tax=Patiria miniata TaxID=46514 RepID=A0A914A9K4_PATMI|nr:somatostatin receptor type 5-like [Patiria miniata]